jgi:hypothetical protein
MKSLGFKETALNVKRLSLWAGVISPFLFVLIFTIDGFLHPTYSQMTQMISFLSVQAENGWIQNGNFLLCGLLFLIFASGFFQGMRTIISRKAQVVASIFLALAGLALMNEGFNPTSLPGQPLGVHGLLHDIGFVVIFGSLIVVPIVTGQALVKTVGWRGYGWYSIFSGFLTLVLLFSLIFTAVTFPSIVGLVNRLQIFGSFIWYIVTGWHLLARKSPEQHVLSGLPSGI